MPTPTPNLPPQETSESKPEWLSRLEEESYQAELLISGAAIFGCLLLPGLISDLEGYVLYTVNRESMTIWYFIFLFLNMLAYVLIITFLLHFTMRALWVGMVSFNSAYPDGYKPNERFSKHFQQQLIEDIGDVHGYIRELDKSCSTIFGAGFSIAFVALGYILLMSVFAALFYALRDYLPTFAGWVLAGTIFVLVMGFAVFSTILSTKKYRDGNFAKRYHYPIARLFNRAFMNIGYRPASYITGVLTSQKADQKSGVWLPLVVSALIGMTGGMLGMSNMNVRAYFDDVYHRMASDPATLIPEVYADHEPEGYVYHPVIPAHEMEAGELLTVFLPLPNREKFELERQCDLPEASGERNETARNARRAREVDCARSFYRFYLNDRELRVEDLQRHLYGPEKQFGFQATFYRPPAKEGRNLLRIESNYYNDDGAPRVAQIPFYLLEGE
ncbi:hypothetical protein CEQ90_15170 [Lewinellaceae bacterium SD302]|nr:hypothetical protein CEQ90_15170 [Lewinellaceae bacterium SD302]